MMFAWLRRYFDFGGRSSRKEYWLGVLCLILLNIAAAIIDMIAFGGISNEGYGPAALLLSLATIIPSVALGVRRLHDIGRTGWWVLIALIPLIGALVLLFWAVQPGQPQENKYGAPPPETPGLPGGEPKPAIVV